MKRWLRRPSLWGALVLSGVCAGPVASQELVTPRNAVQADADTFVRSRVEALTDNYGAQQYIEVGTGAWLGEKPYAPADAKQALIHFDLAAIPKGPLARARLELTVYGLVGGAPACVHTVDVSRVLPSGARTPWIEGNGVEGRSIPKGCAPPDRAFGVAWSGRGPSSANNQALPDFGRPFARVLLEQDRLNVGDKVTLDVTGLVQKWIDGKLDNFGFMLSDTTSDGFVKAIRFGARDGLRLGYPDSVAGPRLQVVRMVSIDVQPYRIRNPVKTYSRTVVKVVLLTTRLQAGELTDFDAITVDPLTVRFGPAGAWPLNRHGMLRDVDFDGDLDNVFFFDMRRTGIQDADQSVMLWAETVDGIGLEAGDRIKTF